MLKNIIDNKWVRLFVSLSIIVSAALELSLEYKMIGAQHGLLIFGVFEFFKVISEIYEATKIELKH